MPTAARLMQSGVDLFAVANVKEASEIREMGSGWPILVLGPLLEKRKKPLVEYDIIPSIISSEMNRFASIKPKKKNALKFTSRLIQEWAEWVCGGKKHLR